MTTPFRLFILSAAALVFSGLGHAQTSNTPQRSSITINQGGYSVLETRPSDAEQSFSDKTRIVRDAYRKRELKKQKDVRDLPAMRTVENTPRSGPAS